MADAQAGVAAALEGRLEAAVDLFTRALATPDLAELDRFKTLGNRGVAWDRLGDFDRAVADHAAAFAMQSDDPLARRNLRIALINRGDAAIMRDEPARAAGDYDHALALDPDDPRALERRGQMRLIQGRLEAARADLARALILEPENAELRALLARLSAIAG